MIQIAILLFNNSDFFFSLFAFTSFRFNLFIIKFKLLMNLFGLKVYLIQGISKPPRNNADLCPVILQVISPSLAIKCQQIITGLPVCTDMRVIITLMHLVDCRVIKLLIPVSANLSYLLCTHYLCIDHLK